MSAILGVFTSDGARLAPSVLGAMLGAMRHRGSGPADVWRAGGATLAVARHAWEAEGALGEQVGVVRDGAIVVVADASLYYVGELRRKLERARMRPSGDSPAHLIAAAYRAWGERCAEKLEGDFAFIVWDMDERRVLAARDFGGKRALHYATIGGMLIVASTIGGVLAHPACPRALDERVIGEVAAGFFATDDATCYRAVFTVPAGQYLAWRRGETPRLSRSWNPPAFESTSSSSLAEGAAELRELLVAAVSHRLGADGATSVWLSGGWDSTAVYGAGQELVRGSPLAHRLPAVSVSYPKGDPGREDELIEEVASFWGQPVHWVRSEDIGLFGDAVASARRRDEPFSHAFELWLRALSQGSLDVGTRVALDGSGGDQLFQVSLVYLADLMRRGSLLRVAREWRAKGMAGTGFRSFFRWAVLPLLPPVALDAAERVRGRPLLGHLDRRVPSWIDRRFVARESLQERGRASAMPELRRGSSSSVEARWYLTHPLFGKVFSCVGEIALEQGVEVRSPLLDNRVVAFAASRPVEERSFGAETKRLLREAMAGLLPPSVLAPRRYKTGTTDGLFGRTMYAESSRWIDGLLDEPVLGDLGIVSPAEVRRAWEQYRRTGDSSTGIQLYFTLQTELWLRARGQRKAPPVSTPERALALSRLTSETRESAYA